MSKSEKKEIRIHKNPNNISIEDFESLIMRYGEIIKGGSRPKAHIGNHIYPYKRENPIKASYVEAVIRLIDELEGD